MMQSALRFLISLLTMTAVLGLPSTSTMGGRAARSVPGSLRLRGGSSAASTAQSSSMSAIKEGAKRRAQAAKEALAKEPKEKVSFIVGVFRGILWVTNKLRITGYKTEVIKGRIVESRNPIQKLSLFIWNFFAGIGLFCRTLFMPAEGTAPPPEEEEEEGKVNAAGAVKGFEDDYET
mmetsp:Transcript_14430/g.28803  ORF Transcript_14430/g.28803 Transcript_14430/m.28803 type:complete len:177 (-) Transcript_14430:187-717(-)